MAAAASRVLGVSYCARRAFRPHHMAQYFTGPEHTLTAYWLHRYEEKLSEPLWIHIVGSYQVKPVVRNSSRRRLRRGIHAALAEAGYAVDGKIAQPPLGSDGASVIQTPTAPLTGTVMVTIKDALAVMEMGEEECLKVGREIVQKLRTPKAQGARPLIQGLIILTSSLSPPATPRRKKLTNRTNRPTDNPTPVLLLHFARQ
ncbi:unnamed protein product [Parascedosporium putredinis]|uniref:Uncharacterized protein n=1 Tax=Parascedosporium putredinis TaxID=1442378 RepID=A0A9P1M610_9PEZI|nr:unnamed protein product [Parascedosporium putredinis]CAI7987880.1 unnamed protein product [Parascedosporium putredinis]